MQSVDPVICLLDSVQQLRVYTKNGIRLDGRGFNEHRSLQCKQTFLTSTQGVIGSSNVQLGSTIVVCGITLMVGVPAVASPNCGDAGIATLK
jgi:exosome complex RNA-binding protein Rrp42 (RNase PH superfamily)